MGIADIGTQLIILVVAIAIILGIAYYMNSQGSSSVQQIGRVTQGASQMANKFLDQIDTSTFKTREVTLYIGKVRDLGSSGSGSSDNFGVDLGSQDIQIETKTLEEALNTAHGTKMVIYYYDSDSSSWKQLTTVKMPDGSSFTIPTTYDPTTLTKILKGIDDGDITDSKGNSLKGTQFMIIIGSWGSKTPTYDSAKNRITNFQNTDVNKPVYVIQLSLGI